jgi:hypothetical protein
MTSLATQLFLSLSRVLRLSSACGVLAALAFSASYSEASIVQPGLPEFILEEASPSSGASERPYSGPERAQPEEDKQIAFDLSTQNALANNAGSSSGTSTGTSGGSTSTSTVALRTSSLGSLADLSLAGWVASEQRFFLPDSPANQLLRPPQDRNASWF